MGIYSAYDITRFFNLDNSAVPLRGHFTTNATETSPTTTTSSTKQKRQPRPSRRPKPPISRTPSQTPQYLVVSNPAPPITTVQTTSNLDINLTFETSEMDQDECEMSESSDSSSD